MSLRRRVLKGASLLALGLTTAIAGYSQKWVDLMLEEDANFYEIQKAFNKEWKGKSYVRGKGYKQYKRWEWFWETRINPDGSFPDFRDGWHSYQDFMSRHVSRNGGDGNWTPLGPFTHTNTDSWSAGQGRVNTLERDPVNTNTLYVGAPAGGIWKSTDNGSTWTPLGDELPRIGVSSIAIDPTDTDVIYIATGDAYGGDTPSVGLWKSTDGGQTWTEVTTLNVNSTNQVKLDPTDNNTIWVAANNGMYKSTDGGTTWNNTRFGNFEDFAFKPNDANTLYAVTNSRLYRTTDGGANWTQITDGLPSTSGRMQVETTPANNNYVYVLSTFTNWDFQGIYRSTDAGTTFTARNTTADVFDGSSQAWYDLALGVSEVNAELLMLGVLNVHRSLTGGSTWQQVNNWNFPSGQAYTHADIHYIRFYGDDCYVGSDGGLYRSFNNGNTFTSLTNGLQISQFYRIAGTEADVTRLAGGLQDNGGYALVNGQWRNYYGADGMGAAIDPNDADHIFGMIQNGDLFESFNGALTSSGRGSPEGGAWVTPLEADPNGGRVLAGYNDLYEYSFTGGWSQISTFNFPGLLREIEIYPANSQTIYVSSFSSLYRTTDGGATFTNITSGINNSNSGITSIEVHPSDPNKVWVTTGSSNGNRVYETLDGGSSWTSVTGTLPSISVNIVKYEPGTQDGIYVGTDVGVYYRDDFLGDWIPFMNNLPNTIVNDLEINSGDGVIRAGTYGRGIWESGTYASLAFEDDAGIEAVVVPSGTNCNPDLAPILRLRNYGLEPLTSVTLHYNVDGGAVQTMSWNGNLATDSTADVTFPVNTFAPGAHSIEAWTTQPNGVLDQALFNDRVASTFAIEVGSQIDFTLSTDCWGNEVTWQVINTANGDTVFSGGPYSQVAGGETFMENWCLVDGCYEFRIQDSYGDGMFGSAQGNCGVDGNFFATGAQGLLFAMGTADYGSGATFPFCVTSPLQSLFNANEVAVCTDEPVNFQDFSLGSPTTWSWSFPGGTPATSTLQNPTVTYATPGLHDVTLTVSSAGTSASQTLSSYILVHDAPSAVMNVTNESCEGACDGAITMNIVGGTAPFTINWSNGLDSDTLHTDLCPNTYQVGLVDNNGCSPGAINAVVNGGGVVPTANWSPSAQTVTIQSGATVDFTDLSTNASAWLWTFGDGNSSTLQNPTHTYAAVGSYTVFLEVTSPEGCTATWAGTIKVEDLTSSIDETGLSASISTYPNPTNGDLNIALDIENYEEANAVMYNTLGEVVASKTFANGSKALTLDLSQAAKAVYYLHITIDGEKVVRKVSVIK